MNGWEANVGLAGRGNRTTRRDQIMDALKGHPLEAFDRSIDVHISRIRALIEDDPKNPRRVLTVRGAGYVFARKQDAEDASGSVKSLYLRIYLTVVAVLLLFALVAGFLASAASSAERENFQAVATERAQPGPTLIENACRRPPTRRGRQARGVARMVAAPAPAARAGRRQRPAHRRLRDRSRAASEVDGNRRVVRSSSTTAARCGCAGSACVQRLAARRRRPAATAAATGGRRRLPCGGGLGLGASSWCCSSPSRPAPTRWCAG